MEEIIENTDPLDNQPAIMDLTEDKITLLKTRGFFPTSSGLIDDTFYGLKKDLRRNAHLREHIKVQELIDLPYDELKEMLYMKDSMLGMEVAFSRERGYWLDSFGGYKRYYDVEPLYLEPYIARYVRAINRCGMQTFFSCDGWHTASRKSKEMVIIFSDRYSWIWHKLLYLKNCIKVDCFWEYEKSGKDYITRILLPKGDDGKLKIFNQVLKAAYYIAENSDLYKAYKEYVIQNVSGMRIDDLPDGEVKKELEDNLDMYIRLNDIEYDKEEIIQI